MNINCNSCGYDCQGCFQRLQQNVEDQAKIILKRNLEIIELSQRAGELKKQLAELQAEVERQKGYIKYLQRRVRQTKQYLSKNRICSDCGKPNDNKVCYCQPDDELSGYNDCQDCQQLREEVNRLEELVLAYESARALISSEFYNRVAGSIEEGIKGEKGGDDELSEM